MVEVIWTNQSINDIDSIAEFIATDSKKYATIQAQRFFEATEILTVAPFAGRIVPEIQDENLREIIVGFYRIIYLIASKNKIEVLTVHHSKRLLTNNPVFKK